MKRRNISLLALASLTLFTFPSCSSDPATDEQPAPAAGLPVRLAATDGTLSFDTRAVDASDPASSTLLKEFSGDQVRVVMSPGSVNTGGTDQALFTAAAPSGGTSALSLVANETALAYPNSAVTLYAVHPSDASTLSSHTVLADQRTADNYKKSDLLYAYKSVPQAAQGDVQTLPFSHQLVKLLVTVNLGGTAGTLQEVKLHNVLRKVTYGSSMGTNALTLTAESEGTDEITFGPTEGVTVAGTYTYSCVFPAQEWGDGTTAKKFLTVTTSLGTATYNVKTNTPFAGGKTYRITLSLSSLTAETEVTFDTWPSAAENLTAGTSTKSLTLSITGGPFALVTTGDGTVLTAGTNYTVKNQSGAVLDKDTHYTVEYKGNKTVGPALMIVTGKGDYAGLTALDTFEITE